MPRGNNNPAPPDAMTWSRAAPVLAFCFVFDALRFMFEMFWFFGPILAGGAVSAILGGGTIGNILGSLAGAVSFFGAPVFETIGVVMAIAVGLIGWLTIGLLLALNNARIFGENAGNGLWFAGGLLISEIPILGALPAITVSVGRMYHVQIKKEAQALKDYRRRQAQEQRQERDRQIAEFERFRALQAMQAANEESFLQEASEAEQAAAPAGEAPSNVIPFPGRTPAASGGSGENIPREMKRAA